MIDSKWATKLKVVAVVDVEASVAEVVASAVNVVGCEGRLVV